MMDPVEIYHLFDKFSASNLPVSGIISVDLTLYIALSIFFRSRNYQTRNVLNKKPLATVN